MAEDHFKKFYGKNYQSVVTESKKVRDKLKDDFIKEYQDADISKFNFSVSFKKRILKQDPETGP